MQRTIFLPLLVCWSSACVPVFSATYGLGDLRGDSQQWPGHALVHYLSRPHSEPQDCTAENLQRTDEALIDPFVAAFEDSQVPPSRWADCAAALLPTLPAASRSLFLDRVARVTTRLAQAGKVDRLVALNQVIASRPRETSPELKSLRRALEPFSEKPGVAQLRQTLELDEGQLNGVALTAEGIEAINDEALLRRISARHPDEVLRFAARRRIIRQHIAASTWAEVKARAAEVEASVLRTGRWAQATTDLTAPVPPPPVPLSTTVVATQDVANQHVSWELKLDQGRHLDIRPLLRFPLGLSQPLSLCSPADAFDVSPCIDASSIRLGTNLATLDDQGRLSVPESIAMADLMELARRGLGLVVPLSVGTLPVQSLQLPLAVPEPNAFYFEGAQGSVGPAVNVVVTPAAQTLLIESVDERGVRKKVILPRSAKRFELGSRGGNGAPGRMGFSGANGSNGFAGMSAVCPGSSGSPGGRGGDGYPGGPGGPGGAGGDGGQVRVQLRCGANCQDEVLVRSVFRSKGGLGGAGGPGGPGGIGGNGGMGGSGTSCYANGRSSYLSAGPSGTSGLTGQTGYPGSPGAAGRDGLVQVELVQP
jgi:hypothetical protein